MGVRIVRLGTTRLPGEGTRIGTVRHLPRGVRKDRYAEDWFDVWYPDLAPSAALVAKARGAQTEAEWRDVVRAFRREMDAPVARRALDLLAALSHGAAFSVGCYCADEARCHRTVLRALLAERGAAIAPSAEHADADEEAVQPADERGPGDRADGTGDPVAARPARRLRHHRVSASLDRDPVIHRPGEK
jgi:uncharacterized protein YeaO (DUF488 family)